VIESTWFQSSPRLSKRTVGLAVGFWVLQDIRREDEGASRRRLASVGLAEGRRFDAEAKAERTALQRLKAKMLKASEEPRVPRPKAASSMTVDEYVRSAVAAQGADVEFRTWNRRLGAWKSLAGSLADISLRNLKVADVRDWRAELPRTRNAEFAIEAIRMSLEAAGRCRRRAPSRASAQGQATPSTKGPTQWPPLLLEVDLGMFPLGRQSALVPSP